MTDLLGAMLLAGALVLVPMVIAAAVMMLWHLLGALWRGDF